MTGFAMSQIRNNLARTSLHAGFCVHTFVTHLVSCEKVQRLDHKTHLRAWSQAAPLQDAFLDFGVGSPLAATCRKTYSIFMSRTMFSEMCLNRRVHTTAGFNLYSFAFWYWGISQWWDSRFSIGKGLSTSCLSLTVLFSNLNRLTGVRKATRPARCVIWSRSVSHAEFWNSAAFGDHARQVRFMVKRQNVRM